MEKDKKKNNVIDFKEGIERFKEDVTQLIENSSLSEKEDFLDRVASDVSNLYSRAMEILQSNYGEIEEVGTIIQNIFILPLNTGKKEVTFLNATQEYPDQKGSESDLSEIIQQYVKCPESTKSFVRELELLSKDVELALEAIA